VLPNSPSQISVISRHGALKNKRDLLLRRLHGAGHLSESDLRLSILEPIPSQHHPLPFEIPHLVLRLRGQYSEPVINSTIDLNVQHMVERKVTRHMNFLKSLGALNCAVIVAEVETGKVRAYVGSQDYADNKGNGKVNGASASRSSGSILKPFLYAMAIDEGVIHPQSMMLDIPSNFNGFTPSNPLKTHDGVVRVSDSLIRSLNVTATRLLNTVGVHEFYDTLKALGLTHLFRAPEDYGLPLILGGAEMSLEEAVAIYQGLGRLGVVGQLNYVEAGQEDSVLNRPERVFSKGASLQILNILQNVNRPGSEYYWEKFAGKWPLGWKTGTSYGQKDAWSIGVSPQWVVGVWVGDFTGKGNKNLGGARFAGPLLFEVFNALPKRVDKRWFPSALDEYTQISLCNETGFKSGPDCDSTHSTYHPKGASSLQVCPYHFSLIVNLEETEQVCSGCWENGAYKRISRVIYPPEVRQHQMNSGHPITPIPSHRSSCTVYDGVNSMSIVYPVNNARIFLPLDIGGVRQKVTLEAAHSNPENRIFWYVDKLYVGQTQKYHKISVPLTPGSHTITIVDENGYKRKSTFISK
jgi:penicillin-binding protein 1C